MGLCRVGELINTEIGYSLLWCVLLSKSTVSLLILGAERYIISRGWVPVLAPCHFPPLAADYAWKTVSCQARVCALVKIFFFFLHFIFSFCSYPSYIVALERAVARRGSFSS
jgi:hypothetical protein